MAQKSNRSGSPEPNQVLVVSVVKGVSHVLLIPIVEFLVFVAGGCLVHPSSLVYRCPWGGLACSTFLRSFRHSSEIERKAKNKEFVAKYWKRVKGVSKKAEFRGAMATKTCVGEWATQLYNVLIDLLMANWQKTDLDILGCKKGLFLGHIQDFGVVIKWLSLGTLGGSVWVPFRIFRLFFFLSHCSHPVLSLSWIFLKFFHTTTMLILRKWHGHKVAHFISFL